MTELEMHPAIDDDPTLGDEPRQVRACARTILRALKRGGRCSIVLDVERAAATQLVDAQLAKWGPGNFLVLPGSPAVAQSDGMVEVRGVVAMNGRGELCFFAHSRANGVPIPPRSVAGSLEPLDGLARLWAAVDNAPARRKTHNQLEDLDP